MEVVTHRLSQPFIHHGRGTQLRQGCPPTVHHDLLHDLRESPCLQHIDHQQNRLAHRLPIQRVGEHVHIDYRRPRHIVGIHVDPPGGSNRHERSHDECLGCAIIKTSVQRQQMHIPIRDARRGSEDDIDARMINIRASQFRIQH